MRRGRSLRKQLLDDLQRLHALTLQVAAGDGSAKRERDELEGAIHVKLVFWRAGRRGAPPGRG